MRIPPQQRRLADGRLHLHDGPIDLIIEAFGENFTPSKRLTPLRSGAS